MRAQNVPWEANMVISMAVDLCGGEIYMMLDVRVRGQETVSRSGYGGSLCCCGLLR